MYLFLTFATQSSETTTSVSLLFLLFVCVQEIKYYYLDSEIKAGEDVQPEQHYANRKLDGWKVNAVGKLERIKKGNDSKVKWTMNEEQNTKNEKQQQSSVLGGDLIFYKIMNQNPSADPFRDITVDHLTLYHCLL